MGWNFGRTVGAAIGVIIMMIFFSTVAERITVTAATHPTTAHR
jgi:hypothetical protein